VILIIPRLPDLKTVGGNSRHAHPQQRAKAFKEEKDSWGLYLLEQIQLGKVKDSPYLEHGKAKIHVTLVFPQNRRRDGDNLHIALKPLWDAMRYMAILYDDDVDHLTVTIEVEIDKARAPLTIITMESA
jgi:hypothetical protein